MSPTLSPHHPTITQACQRHHVARLSVFGSAPRDDFWPG